MSLVDETENEHVEYIPRQQQIIIVDAFEYLILLHIVKLARIVHLVHNHLLDVVSVVFRVTLNA